MKILAIDPGSSCGYALGDDAGATLNSGVWQLGLTRGDSPGMRYIRLRGQLNTMKAAYPDLGLIVYEQPQAFLSKYRGGTATEIAYAMVGEIQSWCTGVGLQHTSVHAATVKKFATGKGNANKEAMVRAGRLRFKTCSENDNEVDALWILALHHSNMGQPQQSAQGAMF